MRDLFPKGTQIRCSNTKGGVPALSGEMGTVEYIGDSGILADGTPAGYGTGAGVEFSQHYARIHGLGG